MCSNSVLSKSELVKGFPESYKENLCVCVCVCLGESRLRGGG